MHSNDDRSESIEGLLARGVQLQGAGHHGEALAVFSEALAREPAHPVAHRLAGDSNLQLGRVELGIAHSRAAAAGDPQSAAAWCNLALGQQQSGRTREALVAAKRAVALEPRLAAAWNALGLIAQDAGNPGEARANFMRALEIDPNHAGSQLSLANLDQVEGRIDAALAGYARAQSLDPRSAQAPYNRGHLFHRATGDMVAAIASYREAIALRSEYAPAHHNLAHALLLTGRFAEAWPEYLWRMPHDPPAQDPPKGSRLLVMHEHGVGDVLFFLRFAPPLRDKGVTLEFCGDPRLRGMLARTGLFDRIISPEEKRPDERAPEVLSGDLPLLLDEATRTRTPVPLALAPEPARLSAMRERLERLGPAPYIGVAWRASTPASARDELLLKEIPLEGLGSALKDTRGTFVAVQREPHSGEIDALSSFLGAPLHDLSAVNEDLEDLLALMTALDRYVGVSSTSVHLRAGTGGAASILVPFPYEWRWMAVGDSPWFPGMQVYRQRADGSWNDALARLAARPA